ncbi:MAG: AzlD domain-containing protein [Clostridia bacterium]|nr:AzlD domain-containing protein [Clostridia bacterium]
MNKAVLYILVAFVVTYAIRVLPLTLLRKPIKSRFIRSFLYYVPYVTLAVMTFPAVLETTENIWSGLAAFVIGLIVAYISGNLFIVALSSCAAVVVVELVLKYIL